MSTDDGTGFEPATGDGPPPPETAERRAGSLRTAYEGMLQIRRLTNTEHADPEAVPAPWEVHRTVRAVALALEAAGIPPSALDASGARVALGYRVSPAGSPGSVRVEWLGPSGSGAAQDEEEALPRCAEVLRRLGWTALLYRGPRRRRFLEVEAPAGPSGGG
ncbi:hypothetical protein [Streptomyces fulvorobeus]|uniref:Uncharacterized protein n=1 Tax=Streptomyces fulvorobeus TaxID=284028 RepID=A0A7J0CEQ4_9ACTN|nr:hypothetical protein [Streptomyces fulvorobeus]NYE44458.1 hypothetical protein [Streptomyces fulvorobeus]GFN00992.1 hypothetical protein Sfulv_58020 [Streptomyces fulvorobeus]